MASSSTNINKCTPFQNRRKNESLPSQKEKQNKRTHDVFLSFRGPDTRQAFTGHLHQALVDKGIYVFFDNDLERGEEITSQLLRVIQESRISIAVLSENYASSPFCLDELVKILQCGKLERQIVIPVFYHVDPTEVEEQTGSFGQEFTKLKAQFDNEGDKVHNWRLALTKVATLPGYHLKEGDHEANTIQNIVSEVSTRLCHVWRRLDVGVNPVGLDSRVEYIHQKLEIVSDDVCMIGLHGMGGIGKTTLAKALYNKWVGQFQFDGCCFLHEVREKSKKDGFAQLQENLLREVLRDKNLQIGNSDNGIELIKHRLCSKKVLILIDDVDHIEQLEKLAGDLKWFGAGSIIIITTRDLHLLNYHAVTIVHKVKKMNDDEAMRLLSWHAFKQALPTKDYMELSKLVVGYAGGLPLALKVLGSCLHGGNLLVWKDVLNQLKRCPNDEIISKLKISYDGLDSEEKAIFLDIACLLKGKPTNEVIKFISASGFGAHSGFERLIQKSLVSYTFDGQYYEVHDLLEEMAIKIGREEASRLFIRKREDIPSLFSNDKSPHIVEGILFDFDEEEEEPLNLLKFTNLRILMIRNSCFTKVPRLPNNIKWLEWRHCPIKSMPSEVLPAKIFSSLTRMDFSNCEYLREIVDCSAIPNLKLMRLDYCTNLGKIDVSIGNLKKLKTVNLAGCRSLTSLPSLLENQLLDDIYLKYCSNLKNLPNLPTSLTRLRMDGSGVKEIPFIGNLINLRVINATNCDNLIWVSNSIYKLPKSYVTLRECPKLQLPVAESSIVSSNPISTKRFHLTLSCNDFVSLPMNAFKYTHITRLGLQFCKRLVEIPELPHTLKYLGADGCTSLVRFSQFQFHNFEGDFSHCVKMTEKEMKSWREMVENLSDTRNEEDYPLKKYSILFPGNEIPEWFSCRFERDGNGLYFELPLSMINDNLIAIAVCAVLQIIPPDCHFKFKMNDFTLCSFKRWYSVELEHIWIGFNSVFDWPKLLESGKILCKFHSYCRYKPVCKRFAVHFIYKRRDDEVVIRGKNHEPRFNFLGYGLH